MRSSRSEAHAPREVIKPWVRAGAIKQRIYFQINQAVAALGGCFVKLREGFFQVPQASNGKNFPVEGAKLNWQ